MRFQRSETYMILMGNCQMPKAWMKWSQKNGGVAYATNLKCFFESIIEFKCDPFIFEGGKLIQKCF